MTTDGRQGEMEPSLLKGLGEMINSVSEAEAIVSFLGWQQRYLGSASSIQFLKPTHHSF